MAYDVTNGLDVTFAPYEDLSTDQYKFVVLDATATVKKPTGAFQYPIGILQNSPSATSNANGNAQFPPMVRMAGISRLRVDSAYPVGTRLTAAYSATADENGRGTDSAVSASSSEFTAAIMLQASTAEDDIVAVKMLECKPV